MLPVWECVPESWSITNMKMKPNTRDRPIKNCKPSSSNPPNHVSA